MLPGLPLIPRPPAPVDRRPWEGASPPPGPQFSALFGRPQGLDYPCPLTREGLLASQPPSLPTPSLCYGTVFLNYLNHRGDIETKTLQTYSLMGDVVFWVHLTLGM